MTNSPEDQDKVVVQSTQLAPIDPNDSRSVWRRFVDGVRQTIGLKPVYLAERWAEAKVRQEEIDAESASLAAKANYELAMALVRKMERESESQQELDSAVADYIRSQTDSPDIVLSVIKNLRNSKSQSSEETLEYLRDVTKRIEFQGGTVEIETPGESPLE